MTKAIYLTDKIEGTREILDAVLSESNPSPAHGNGWRPVRAAAVKAMRYTEAPPAVHMTTEEFTAWLERHSMTGRGSRANLQEQVAISKERKLFILEGARIKKVEALAMAHFALGLRPPVPAGNAGMFKRFVTENFGRPVGLTKVLEVEANSIRQKMEGFRLVRGVAMPRPTDIGLIRAIDWVRRFGPYSPYGDQPSTKEF